MASAPPDTPADRDRDDDLGVECPRCGRAVEVRYYGPCTACAGQLRATYRAEARHVEVPEYEPKLNVTPNAVATKE